MSSEIDTKTMGSKPSKHFEICINVMSLSLFNVPFAGAEKYR